MAKRRGKHPRSKGAEDQLRLYDGVQVDVGDTTLTVRVDQQRATIFLGDYESSAINLADPGDLDFEYMQQMTAVVDGFFPRPQALRALHLGGCGCSLAWAWETHRPGSNQVAVEINPAIADACRQLFDLPRSPRLRIRVEDAASAVAAIAPQSMDVVVRDVFAGAQTPRQVRTLDFFNHCRRVLRPQGVLVANIGHGKGLDARVDCAAVTSLFRSCWLIGEGKVLSNGRRGNLVLVATNRPEVSQAWDEATRGLRRLPFPVRVLSGADLKRWIGSTAALVSTPAQDLPADTSA
ncbi:MAG: fused MFS/spermidine synthase [Actinomycetaceae bacterium]|nr:fused MFS/spermidine synthase [Actinomycetaceae bacterium]